MSTDILVSIDRAVRAWEERPESWLPGDPLYQRPGGAAIDTQTIRPMFEVLDDVDQWWWRPRCEDCDVSWEGIGSCWMCGQEQPPEGLRNRENYDFMVRMVVRSDEFARQLVQTEEALHRMWEGMQRSWAESADARALEGIFAAEEPPAAHANARCVILPSIEDVTAPTMAELARGIEQQLVVSFDFGDLNSRPMYFSVRRPVLANPARPHRLLIDGPAYHRRRRARTRRNR